MTLGFKDRFVPFVRNGSKTHTIRAYSHRRPFRVGDICHCYAKVRTKEQALIGAWPCVKVQQIEISRAGDLLAVSIDGVPLTLDEIESLFWRDGFRPRSGTSSRLALQFWKDDLPFIGQIIHWTTEVKRSSVLRRPGARRRESLAVASGVRS